MKKFITLLTDFGLKDNYVSVMKGVIYSKNKDAVIIDISHDLKAFAVDEAAYLIYSSYGFFPEGTIHVIVVDPGVGSDRKILAFKTEKYIFLAPDNGVLKFLFNELHGEVFQITNKKYFLGNKISNTFHGRDIFAPVAAFLSKGTALSELGEKTENFKIGNMPFLKINEEFIEGEIIYIDRFGNLVTNIEERYYVHNNYLSAKIKNITVEDLKKSFSNVQKRENLMYTGSMNFLEIGKNGGDFAEENNIKIGDKVILTLKPEK